MYITVIGCGYVGLVTASGLADTGHCVTAVDHDAEKIDLLRNREIPIHEPGLKELVEKNLASQRLIFTDKLKEAVGRSQIIFIAVGTPSMPDGKADISQVESAVREIAVNMNGYKVIVNKSTVPVGTGRRVREIIGEEKRVKFDVVSNPEFLREGSAVKDFFHPDRIIIGTESGKAVNVMKEVYNLFLKKKTPFLWTDLETAELIKYTANAFLAMKISFINEIANLCEAVGADVKAVAEGIGLDHRIGSYFLLPGPGYGGSCFPKDTRALIEIARNKGERLSLVETVVESNERQKRRMVEKIKRALGDPRGKILGVLGITFKANTDDLRESPAIPIITELLLCGAEIRLHDPVAMKKAEMIFSASVHYCSDEYEAITGADALVVMTEWNSYLRLDFDRVKKIMRNPIIIDLRNIYDPSTLKKHGFTYVGVGRF